MSLQVQNTMTGKEKKYSCDRCGNGYQTNFKHNLLRHIQTIHEGNEKPPKDGIHKCTEVDWCNYQTMNSGNLKRHIQSKHREKKRKNVIFVKNSLQQV